jgi:DNA-binding NarL/FixJ family response regulator
MISDKFAEVILADSHYLTIEALQSLIGRETTYSVKAVATSPAELLHCLGKTKNGLLVIDPSNLHLESGKLSQIKQQFPHFSWLVLTEILTKIEFDEFIQAGIRNIIYKNTGKQELLAAMEAAIHGKKYFSDEVLDLALGSVEKKTTAESSVILTSSEFDIVRMIANGLTTKEIASKKNISYHTVNTHRKNIFRKMEVSNSSELILRAIKSGWIDNIEYFI